MSAGLPTAAAAEDAFYAAFGAADLDALMAVWAPLPTIACIHPTGPRLDGPLAIRRSFEFILADGVRRQFELRARRSYGESGCRVDVLEEHITVPGSPFRSPPVLATNVYLELDGRWYLALHHASVMVQVASPAGDLPRH